jgi:hypothetical protein
MGSTEDTNTAISKQIYESDQIDTTQSQPAEHDAAAGNTTAAKTAGAASSSLTHDELTKATEHVDLDQSTEEIEQKTAPEQIGDTKGTDAAPAEPQPFIAELTCPVFCTK